MRILNISLFYVNNSPNPRLPLKRGFFLNPTIGSLLLLSFLSFSRFTLANNIIEFDGGKIILEGKDLMMCENVTSGGEIAADEFGCPNPTWDPSLIVNVELPSGGTGALEYIWIYTTDDPSSPGAFWNPIIGSTSAEFDPGPISVTTYYRRCARREGCTDYIGESNIVMKEAICCDNVTDGGEIAADQALCEPPFIVNPLTNVVLPSGGSNALEYQWAMSNTGTPYTPTNPDWSFIQGATEMGYDPGILTGTTYFVRLSRRHGCLDYVGVSNIIEIYFNDGIVATLSGINEECLGASNGSVNVDDVTGGQPIYSYEWLGFPGETNSSLPNLSAGTYQVIVTDSYGCTGTAELSLEDGPELTINTDATPVSCVGDEDGTASVVDVPDGIGPYSYQWDDPFSQTDSSIIDLTAASYQVVVTDSRGCTGSGIAVVEDAIPLDVTSSSVDASCDNSADGSASVQVTGGILPYTYRWDDPASQTTATASNLQMGTYSVTIADVNGCNAFATVIVGAPMQAELNLSETDALCFGSNDGTATVAIVNGDINNYNVIWSNGETTPQITNLSPDNYSVTVSDANGCSVEGAVAISDPPILDLVMGSDSAMCFSSSDGGASVSVSGGTPFPNNVYQYEWSVPGSPNTSMLDNVMQGNYTITVTDANGCTMTNNVDVGAPDEMQINLTPTHVSCNGLTDGSAIATVTGGIAPYTYLWNDPSGSTSNSISNLAPGAYGLSVTDANSCLQTTILNITEPAPLVIDFNNVDVVCEEDTDGVAVAVPTGGTEPYSFLWEGGQTTQAIFNVGVGGYGVTVTDENGCQSNEVAQINFTSTLESTVTTFDATCYDVNNGVAIASGVNGSPPYSYIWSNGETTEQINDLFFGTFDVTVSDQDGCVDVNSAIINSPPLLIAPFQILSEVLTYGGNEGSVEVNPSGGVPPYDILWSNGSTTNVASELEGGVHTVTITDANDCYYIGDVTLIEPSKVGDFVWDDENQNGIQDFGETGIEGINVTLTGVSSNGDSVNLNTVTDTVGYYEFDGLAQGFYRLYFETMPNHVITYQNVGNDALDSDPDPTDGETQGFPLSDGQFESRWDCGMVVLDEKIDIGDKVWYDVNRNGLQDPNEAGVEDVMVRLRELPSNFIIAVDVTDILGNYRFEDVYPGNYRVEFVLASFPAGGYILSPKDQGNDDNIDSDADVNTGITDQFTVFPFTLDNLTIDAGIFKECDNITDGGVIGYDEELCGVGADPAEIVNVVPPSGGYGTIEYLWMQSLVPIYNGPGDPNWTIIPNSNSPTYDPGPISQSTYYIRCARREGCDDYIGESNVVAKEITPYPLTQIIDEPNILCENEEGRFEAAIAGAGATYFWEFSGGGNPSTASTRVVDPVSWPTEGVKTITLTVTRFGCSFSVTTQVVIEDCGFSPLMSFGGFDATLDRDQVSLGWEILGNADNTIFFVQRSEDGRSFSTIGNLKGLSSTEQSTYSFIDEQPRFGENIYRIQYEKLDDSNENGFSQTVSIIYQPNATELAQVFPNPTSGKITVELMKPNDEPAYGEVLTPYGNVVATFLIPADTEKFEVDLSDQFDGLYLVTVKQDKLKKQICKVFKAK